ncbi:MAG TPA: penicillin acylase family protein [Actinoplanes sp.]|nr:penicillin acylase family protein [Actinoplanes sp.]
MSEETSAIVEPETAAEPPVRRKRRRWPRILMWIMVVLLVLIAGVGYYGVWSVRRPLAQYDGTLRLAGLSQPVTVYRDAQAVPQIYAHTADDMYKAQGYVTAQERFWEMDFRRHVTSGTLAEMFGASQVANDEYIRTMGWRRVAEQELPMLSPQSRQYLQDYADGVNAYLAGKSAGQVSLEYTLLGLEGADHRIAPWTPLDSVTWLKAMAWNLRGNLDDEITRADLLAGGLTRAQVESLYPPYPGSTNAPIVAGGSVENGVFTPLRRIPVTAPAGYRTPSVTAGELREVAPQLTAIGRGMDALPALTGARMSGIGSNSYVVSGALTRTGKPILENDPHLAPSMPGVWFQIGLHCDCGRNVTGFSFSGMPGVIIGHNDRVAWGFTNLNPDVTDLFLEKVRGDKYLVDGVWKDLAVRTEVIKVSGGTPVTFTVRETDNGPLMDAVSKNIRNLGRIPGVDPSGAPLSVAPAPAAIPADAYAVAMRWTALTPGRTMDALFALNQAQDFTQFRAAAAQFEVPAQNLTYADVDGNIGYQAPGRIPIRGKGDGRWPVPGWDSAYGWKGYIPPAALPYAYNPPSGVIATANNQVIDPHSYPYLLTGDWADGYRSQRLLDLVRAQAPLSVESAANLAFDQHSAVAASITPTLLSERLTGSAAKAQDLLRGWDFQQPATGPAGSTAGHSSAAAAYFNAVWKHLLADTFDELPAPWKPTGGERWWLVMTNLMKQPADAWWDVRSTLAVEKRDDIVTKAMTEASAELTGSLGGDPAAWRWGAIHTLSLRNQSFGTSGIAPIEWLFNPDPVAVGGGGGIVDANAYDASQPGYAVNAVPSMRMVVDLSNLDGSRWIQLTGESGHAFGPHYTDQLELWRTGKFLPMRWNQDTIGHEARNTLTLKP